MDERAVSGRPVTRPPVSYHRLPPYLRPTPGRPAHLEMFFLKRGACPKDPATGCPIFTAHPTHGKGGSFMSPSPLPTPVALDPSLCGPVQLYLDDAVTASRLHLRQDAQHHALSLPQEHTKKRRRTSRRSTARVDKQVLMLRLPFSRLSLQPLSERSATRDTEGAATGSGQLGARSRKVHPHKDIHSDQPLDLSRKRKRSNLDTFVGDKHRRVETATPFLPGGVKKCEIVHQVETHKTGEAASTAATPGDVSRGRRRVWRRKQGNSPTKKTTDVPSSTTNRRRIQRLAETPLDL